MPEVEAWLPQWTTLVLRAGPRLVGAVRGRLEGDEWEIGRLMVAPDLRGRGLGRLLLEAIEAAAPPSASRLSLFTGARSERNLRLYKRAGYRRDRDPAQEPGVVRLSRPAPGRR